MNNKLLLPAVPAVVLLIFLVFIFKSSDDGIASQGRTRNNEEITTIVMPGWQANPYFCR